MPWRQWAVAGDGRHERQLKRVGVGGVGASCNHNQKPPPTNVWSRGYVENERPTKAGEPVVCASPPLPCAALPGLCVGWEISAQSFKSLLLALPRGGAGAKRTPPVSKSLLLSSFTPRHTIAHTHIQRFCPLAPRLYLHTTAAAAVAGQFALCDATPPQSNYTTPPRSVFSSSATHDLSVAF